MNPTEICAIALDLGTTAIKGGLLNQQGDLLHIATRITPLVSMDRGRYESDAISYAVTADQVLNELLGFEGKCRTFGICCQRSSFLIWDKSSGHPITPLISWQDNRGASSCAALHVHEKLIRSLSGLPLAPYYFAPKLRSLLLDDPDLMDRLVTGELMVGTLDTFLIWRWTSGKFHVTDPSMAARTLLMDVNRQQWSPQLSRLFNIPIEILPKIMPSDGMDLQLENGLKLTASLGDQSAALIASVTEEHSEALVNLGTGCFVVRHTPVNNVIESRSGLQGYLLTLVYQDKHHHPHFAFEGTLNSIAAVLARYPVEQSMPDELALNNIYCIVEPHGLGAPYFASHFSAELYTDPSNSESGPRFSEPVGDLSPNIIAILLLESIIFRVARILEDFHRDAAIEKVYLSGGLSELKCLQEGIASCVPFQVYRLPQNEASLLGVAQLASGNMYAKRHVVREIPADHVTTALRDKYGRWKKWLDDLLTI